MMDISFPNIKSVEEKSSGIKLPNEPHEPTVISMFLHFHIGFGSVDRATVKAGCVCEIKRDGGLGDGSCFVGGGGGGGGCYGGCYVCCLVEFVSLQNTEIDTGKFLCIQY